MKKISKKLLFIFIGLSISLLVIGSTYGKYIYAEIRDFYLSTKNFYFNSNKLTNPRTIYQVDNWSGVDSYSIPLYLNSKKNNYEICDSDIDYTIVCNHSSNVICDLNKTGGTINHTVNTENIVATITPNPQVGEASLREGETAFIEVIATATSPYTKTISARFTFNVSNMGVGYRVDDEAGRPYFNFNITNTLNYYTVTTAFSGNPVGKNLTMAEYSALSDSDKANCKSALITLTFDPTVVTLDLTSPSYLKAISHTTTTIGGVQYINSYTFNVDAISSEQVKFYKANSSIDYTDSTSIITFTNS